MTQFTHYGLFFTEAHLQRAQKYKDKAPFKGAWELLNNPQTWQFYDTPQKNNADTLLNGYRYRFGDNDAGEKASMGIMEWINSSPTEPLADIHSALVMGQTLELIRPLKDISSLIRQWTDRAHQHLNDYTEDYPHALLAKAQLQLAIGIITENDVMVTQVCDIYQDAINNLHPEGYMAEIVENDNEITNFNRQIQATQTLVLIAEMAKHIGIDLYSYNKRGVSVKTACAYPLYYYFYPEKWRWSGDSKRASEGLAEEVTKGAFIEHGGFLEIIADHYTPPLKAIGMILDDIRPIFNPYGGGLITLTHAPAPRRGLFG